MKLLMMYHSGVGNTRTITEILKNKFNETHEVDIYAIEEIQTKLLYEDYDGFVIGFPTYHTHPSKSIIEFINNIEKLINNKPAYIFTTCGLFSANALRVFAKMCIAKNIIPVLYQSYRCPATDGVLLAPYMKTFFKFEKGLIQKVENDAKKITDIFNIKQNTKLPRCKLISILNYPNKRMGQLITFKIFLHKSNCSKCGKCIKNCNWKAMISDADNFPMFDKYKCEKCYRCIHHCPNKALSLSKRRIPKRQLTKVFFDSYISDIYEMQRYW